MPMRTDETVFGSLMGTLRSKYGHQRVNLDLWRSTLRSYREDLGVFPPQVIAKAFDMAWQKHTEWFPTCGQLLELCKTAEKEVASVTPKGLITEGEPVDRWAGAAEARKILEQLNERVDVDGIGKEDQETQTADTEGNV